MAKSADSSQTPPGIDYAPPPWSCKCSSFWLFVSFSDPLPASVYAPLEASSPSTSSPTETGRFRGGLGVVQVLRYSDTPVGSYDELCLIPGAFELPGTKEKYNRITRIYVSQKHTCYSGRKAWSLPKHLARFSFSHSSSHDSASSKGPLTVGVFPPEPTASEPFFSATLQPFAWAPSLPFSSKVLPYLGIDDALVQPPLPADPERPELVGNSDWLKTEGIMSTRCARGMWVDVKRPSKSVQNDADETVSWWPELSPWRVGLWLEDATLTFPCPEVLK
ncbi:MAG: hypothetical protein M1833_003704 [Piccolia ochrophora]|nr:MAG: hypothetical protein M1833_003704 [Piccolia ochrophora]